MSDEDSIDLSSVAQPIRGMNASVPDMARILGVSNHTIRVYVIDGCPIAVQGGPGRGHVLNTCDVIKWLISRKRTETRGRPKKERDEDDPRERVASATAEKKEIELSILRGESFRFSDLEPFIEDALVDFRGALTELPRAIEEEFGEEPREWLEDRINEALSRLADSLEDGPRKIGREDA